MTAKESFLKGIHILAVDDEEDILETIVEILDESRVDTARDYQSASEKIKERKYDLAILDIMGVDGLKLLEETVGQGHSHRYADGPCHQPRNPDGIDPKRRHFLSAQRDPGGSG